MLTNKFVSKYKKKKVPWGPVGYLVYKRTYARKKSDGTTEEWYETVERCVNAINHLGVWTRHDLEVLYDYVFNLRCCFSGRALWQLGTKTVDRFGGDSLQNCWNVAVNHYSEPFCFAFNELMLGGGVGFNILPENVYELPVVKHAPKIERIGSFDCDYIVPDNRDGWVELLRRILKRHFEGGGDFQYSTGCVRPKGQPISSFGGLASGSEDLVKGMKQIVRILQNRLGQKLRPIDCLDIMNIIGQIVVSGNVRRSAQIAVGSHNDHDFLMAKNWASDNIPNWRAMSNNTVATSAIEDISPDFWEGYCGNGEAYGLINLKTCREYGRLIDGPNHKLDPLVAGVNPCGEIPLESYEACNLAEIFLPNIENAGMFKEAARLMYKCCKGISTLPFIHEQTNEVVSRNRRIGISVTGFLQSKFRDDAALFNEVYNDLSQFDKQYSELLGINESVKLTTVKPSGTLSLLAGVTPGGHPAFAPYYFRRIRMAANDPLVNYCKESGYHVEPLLNFDGTRDVGTMIVRIPIKTPEGTVCAKEMDAIAQLETLRWLQRYWSDNSVSVTVYYRLEELSEIRRWLNKHYHELKSVSFSLHSEHGFKQAPLEEITEEIYLKEKGKIVAKDIFTDTGDYDLEDNLECASGACPIK